MIWICDRFGGGCYAVGVRYFMHVSYGHSVVVDEEGIELRDDGAARTEAIRAARDVMAGDLREGQLDLTSFIAVENEAHEALFTLSFADAVTVKTDKSG